MGMERKDVSIVCPAVGHGNPAAALAFEYLLQAAGLTTDLLLLTWSAIPANVFHHGLRSSPERSYNYSQNGESLRRRALSMMGLLSRIELTGRASKSDSLVATQEHALAGYDQAGLRKEYPGVKAIYIADVQPKESTLDVAKALGLEVLVWNEETAAFLKKRSIRNVQLVQPVLPLGFMGRGKELGKRTDRIIVKSSGSGMPTQYVTCLQEALQNVGQHFSIYLPDRVISETGITPLKGSLRDKIISYYSDLLAFPPRVLISYPSEMTQVVAAGLCRTGVSFITLPTGGFNERRNLEWAKVNKIHTASIIPDDTKDLTEVIKYGFDNAPDPLVQDIAGLGSRSIAEVFREKMTVA